MNEEILWLINSSFRLFLFCSFNQLGVIYFMHKLTARKRSLWVFCIYGFIGAALFYNVCCQTFLPYFFGKENWFQNFFPIISLIMAILSYAMFYYTFEGEFLRIALAGMLSDLTVGMTGFFGLCVVNILEKRANEATLLDYFQWPDLLIGVVQWFCLYLLFYVLTPFINRYKQTPFRHRKILWIIFFIYFGSATSTSFLNHLVATEVYIYLFITAIFGCTLIFFGVWRYRRRIAAEQALLNIQLQAMEVHYSEVHGQIRKMEESQREIAGQMEEIVRMEQSPAADRKIAEYLERLQTEYEEIHRGIYCDSWMMDAVFCYYAEKYREEGIDFDCSMYGYMPGKIDEKDLMQLYMVLLNWGLQVNKKSPGSERGSIRLHTSAVKNQLLIEFFSNGTEKNRAPVNIIRRCIRKYDGTEKIRKEEAGTGITLVLRNR